MKKGSKHSKETRRRMSKVKRGVSMAKNKCRKCSKKLRADYKLEKICQSCWDKEFDNIFKRERV